MRPSLHLIAVALILTVLTVLVAFFERNVLPFVFVVWGGLGVVVIADMVFTVPPSRLTADITLPAQGFLGKTAPLDIVLEARKGVLPPAIALRVELDEDLTPENPDMSVPLSQRTDRQATAQAHVTLTRRGEYRLHALWLRWPSRFSLLDVITRLPLTHQIKVIPDISPIISGAIQTQILPLEQGQKDMRFRGDGAEFHQLREFMPGMDTRTIDWKRSARSRNLVVRETRAERNHQIILCVDSGRLMVEKLAGISKLDCAINASLAMCWAGGLAGDLVGFYNFDSRPRMFVPAAPGRTAFPRLQMLSAQLRYETEETNHTLGLSHLSGRLKRRSLVIIFSDFVDSITAELMMENIQVMARHHFVIYVSLRDPVLTGLTRPQTPDMERIARAVAGRQILQERRVVLEKLSRLGVLCLDTTPQQLTGDLVSQYIDIKLREIL